MKKYIHIHPTAMATKSSGSLMRGNPYQDNFPGLVFDMPGFGVDTGEGDEKANIGISASAGHDGILYDRSGYSRISS